MRAGRVQFAVVGAGISGLACAHRLAQRGADVVVLEASDRVGGRIETIERGGVQFEAGPNTLLAGGEAGAAMDELIGELGLHEHIVEASPAAKRRYIGTSRGLRPVPTNPIAALASPLLGPVGTLRAAADVVLRSPARPDETIAEFMHRRFGTRVLENLVAPFVSGIYAGNVSQLAVRSIFPSLVQAEAERGSVILGMLALRRRMRGRTRPPRRRSITFRAGVKELPQKLHQSLDGRVLLRTPVGRIDELAGRDGSACRIELGHQSTLLCDHVVIATHVRAAAGLVRQIPRLAELAPSLAAMPRASLAVVALLLKRGNVPHALDGFGYLNKPDEGGPVLGCMFRSTIFPHTAPEGTALLTVFIGGMLHPSCAEMDDQSLLNLAREDLQARLGVAADAPLLDSFVQRWPGAIPQFHTGHERVRQRVLEFNQGGPVSLLGNYLSGLSLPDCISGARAHADRLIALHGAPENHASYNGTCGCKEASCASVSY